MNVLENKVILIVSPEPWKKSFVSKHHYARQLALKNDVFFLNPPSSSKMKILSKNNNGVCVIEYDGFVKGLRFFPSWLTKKVIRNKFKQIETALGKKIEVLWSFDNSVFYDFRAIPKRVYTISHIVDLNMNYKFRIATKTANVCFSSTNFILKKQRKDNENSFKIGHGYSDLQSKKHFVLRGDYSINVGYVGNLDIKYLDWDLLSCITSEHSTIGFHFVGPKKLNSEDKSKTKTFENGNVIWYGEKSPEECASFLKTLDCLIVTYKANEFKEQLAFPHKFMEYLGSGNEIVSTYTEEFKDTDLFFMANEDQDFTILFDQVVYNLDEFNKINRRKKREQYALNNTYKKQIEIIDSYCVNKEN